MKLRQTYEKAIDTLWLLASPQRAKMRQHWRRMDNDGDYRSAMFLALRTRGYRAAKKSASQTPWIGGGQSADAEILRDLPALRNRSRELNRDDPLGSGLTKTFVNNIIGRGMRAQARTGNDDKNKRLESVWKERKDRLSPVEDLTHGEGQRLLIYKVLEDGDVLRNAVYSASEPVWFENIEADRLATPGDEFGNPKIRDGVERDSQDRPTHFWIHKSHPGDTFGIGSAKTGEFTKIPAQFIRHLKTITRPGQTRGVPMFHAILQDVRDLDLLIIAGLKRSQIAACLAAFIKSPAEASSILNATAKEYGYVMDQPLEPGMIFKLYPEEEIQTLIPNFPTPELEPFIVLLARRIGAALGVSWQLVLKDFSNSNYSSARTDLLESRQIFVIFQSLFIQKYLNWEWQVVIEDAKLRGDPRLADITRDDILAIGWIPNGWKWVDPYKEALASQIELETGTTTLRDLAAQRGDDWQELTDQRLAEELYEKTQREALGLPPRAVAGQAPPVVDDEEDGESESKNSRALSHDGNGNGAGRRALTNA